jgi:glycosyltransferase involved in cell wall biosynthesis
MATAPRVLFCAFAEVPGPSAASARILQWLAAFGGPHVDAVSLKRHRAPLVDRVAGARMLRVPAAVKAPFLDQLAAYQRALQRQLEGETYDLVWCADLFSAAVAASTCGGASAIFVEITDVPSRRVQDLLGDDTAEVRRKWRDGERAAIRAATRLIVPSRAAAKQLADEVDARMLHVVTRAVDRNVFHPPSIEVEMSARRVVIFGGRESRPAADAALAIAAAVVDEAGGETRVSIAGMSASGSVDRHLTRSLARSRFEDRVSLLETIDPEAAAAVVSAANVVVVPTSAETGPEPLALPHRALEAMSCARAVVVTGHPWSFRDSGRDCENFVVAPAKNPAAVASAVVGLIDDDKARAGVAKRGLRFVAENADVAQRINEVAAIVAEATGLGLRERGASTVVASPATDLAWLRSDDLQSVE